MKRGGYIQRGTALRARRNPKREGTWRDDTPYRAFVRTLECVCLGMPGATRCRGRVEASHVALGPDEKGTGLKVHDRQCVPHCWQHHREWDGRAGRRGMFEDWTRERRWEEAADWVAATQLLATPGDDRRTAELMEQFGLGRIVEGEGGRWTWIAGPCDVGAAA